MPKTLGPAPHLWQTVRFADQEPSVNLRPMCFTALTALLLQGCANTVLTGPAPDEILDGQAKTCTASKPDFTSATAADATIAMTNDGWCGIYATEKAGTQFQLALIDTRAQHGSVYVRSINGRSRIEYTPAPRFVGADAFTLKLRPRATGGAEALLKVAVTVSRGEGVPAEAAPPEKKSAPTPARRAVRRRTTA